MAGPIYGSKEPAARFWHASLSVGHKMYIWGGRTHDCDRSKTTAFIEEFDTKNRSWSKRKTEGTPHPGFSQAACASLGNNLVFYGGNNNERLNGVLSKLDLTTMTWSELSPEDLAKSPMKKDACGMIHFQTRDGKQKLLISCGYALSPSDPHTASSLSDSNGGSSDETSEFLPDNYNTENLTGWTNEFHFFDATNGKKG